MPSPDGTRIAFMNEGGRDRYDGVSVMHADGTGVRPLTPRWLFGLYPDCSPDSRHIVFVQCCDSPQAIWRIGADGNGLKLLIRSPGAFYYPVYAPRGDRIAFEKDSVDGSRFAVWLMRSDGTGAHPIPTTLRTFGTQSWGSHR